MSINLKPVVVKGPKGEGQHQGKKLNKVKKLEESKVSGENKKWYGAKRLYSYVCKQPRTYHSSFVSSDWQDSNMRLCVN